MSELYHYGILGQKWGVRRFQNEDGSLTPEGKQRYRLGVASENAAYRYAKKSEKKNLTQAKSNEYWNKAVDAMNFAKETEQLIDMAKLENYEKTVSDQKKLRRAKNRVDRLRKSNALDNHVLIFVDGKYKVVKRDPKDRWRYRDEPSVYDPD